MNIEGNFQEKCLFQLLEELLEEIRGTFGKKILQEIIEELLEELLGDEGTPTGTFGGSRTGTSGRTHAGTAIASLIPRPPKNEKTVFLFVFM